MDDGTAYLDNYSPFADNDDVELPKIKTDSRPEPKTDSSNITLEQLAEYEQRLDLLEHDIINQEENAQNNQGTGVFEPEPNWPSFYPLIHFDINEVDEQYRSYVNEAFFCWVCMAVSFALNFIGCLSLLSTGDSTESPGSKIALSALYLFLVVPLALDLDALSVYEALKRSPSTLAFTKIFICLAVSVIFELVLFIGMESSGSVGLITLINLFVNKCPGVGVYSIFVCIAFAVTSFFTGKFLIRLWNFFRGTEEGGNMDTNLKTSVAQFVVESLH